MQTAMLKGVAQLIVSVMLLIYAITDCRDQRIWWPLAALAAAAGFVLNGLLGHQNLTGMLAGLLPSLVLLVIALLPGNVLGMGDVITIGAMGVLLGGKETMAVLALALVFTGCLAVILLLLRKAGCDTRLPLMPFLLTAWIAELLMRLFHVIGNQSF